MSYRVLLVDDSPVLSGLIQAELEEAGFEVCCAGCYKAVIDQINSHTFNLILLDVTMPDFDGWQLCARLCERSGAILLLMGAPFLSEHRIQGTSLHYEEMLIKPFTSDILLKHIQAALAKAAAA